MTGRIIDKETGEPLIGAEVWICRQVATGQEGKPYYTDTAGRFAAPDYDETVLIRAGYIGYKMAEGMTNGDQDKCIGLEPLWMEG